MRVQEDSASSISQEEVISAYSDLLVDINTCLQLCKSLETERTYREMVSDWAAGQRGNIPRMVKLMEDLKKEVEKGLCLFMSLSHKLSEVKLLKSCVSDNLKHYGVILTDIFLRFNSAVASLQNVGILKCKKAIKSIAKNVALGSAAIVGAIILPRGVGVVYTLGTLAHTIARYDGAKRGNFRKARFCWTKILIIGSIMSLESQKLCPFSGCVFYIIHNLVNGMFRIVGNRA